MKRVVLFALLTAVCFASSIQPAAAQGRRAREECRTRTDFVPRRATGYLPRDFDRREYPYGELERREDLSQRRRDVGTIAAGAGAGAIAGAMANGAKGAWIGAAVGAGGAAVYTYVLRDRGPDYDNRYLTTAGRRGRLRR